MVKNLPANAGDIRALGSLGQILEGINNIVEAGNLVITIGGEYPTNTGAYLYGAVSTSSNYETAFDVAYILIAPETAKYTLEWNEPALTNALVTLPVFQKMDIGASAVENKDFQAGYLILGINDETGDIYTTDIYGNIKLNVWADPNAINDNGAYVQMAYGLNYGDNKLAYAIPIVRSFAIVPETVKVELMGANDTHNRELLKTFNNQPQGFSVMVSNANVQLSNFNSQLSI